MTEQILEQPTLPEIRWAFGYLVGKEMDRDDTNCPIVGFPGCKCQDSEKECFLKRMMTYSPICTVCGKEIQDGEDHYHHDEGLLAMLDEDEDEDSGIDENILTPMNPKWERFEREVTHHLGIYECQDDTLNTRCDGSFKIARNIITNRFPEIDLEATIAYFKKSEWFCDCELFFSAPVYLGKGGSGVEQV